MASKKDANIFNSECKIRKIDLASEIRGLKIDPETGDIWLSLQDQSICKYSQRRGLSTVANWKTAANSTTTSRVHFEFLPELPESDGVVMCCASVPGFYHIHGDNLVALRQPGNRRSSTPNPFPWAIRTQSGHLLAARKEASTGYDNTQYIGYTNTTQWELSSSIFTGQFITASARDTLSCFLLAGSRGFAPNTSRPGASVPGPYILDMQKKTVEPFKIECDGVSFDKLPWDELQCSIIGTPTLGLPAFQRRPTHSAIITHASRPLVFYNSIDNQWYPHDTITGASISDYDYDTNTLAYANPSHSKTLFIAESFFKPSFFYSTPSFDLHRLHECPDDIPTDVSFTHAASGTDFHLHSFVLPPAVDTAITLKTLASTTLPLRIVRGYVEALYRLWTYLCRPRSPLQPRWKDEDASQELVDSTLLIYLLRITSCNVLSAIYEQFLVKKLDATKPVDVLLKVFLPVWPHCHNNSRVMGIFARTLGRDPTSLIGNSKAIYLVATEELHPSLLRLSINVGDRTYQPPPIRPLQRWEDIMNVVVDEGHLLKWTPKPLTPPPPAAPFTFVFGIGGIEGHVVVRCGWILYSSWSWFRRVLKAKLDEFKTRVVRMPSSMSPALLVALLRKLHTIPEHGLKKLPVSDHVALLALCDNWNSPELSRWNSISVVHRSNNR